MCVQLFKDFQAFKSKFEQKLNAFHTKGGQSHTVMCFIQQKTIQLKLELFTYLWNKVSDMCNSPLQCIITNTWWTLNSNTFQRYTSISVCEHLVLTTQVWISNVYQLRMRYSLKSIGESFYALFWTVINIKNFTHWEMRTSPNTHISTKYISWRTEHNHWETRTTA